MAKQQQKEFDNLPKPSDLGDACIQYLNIKDDIANSQEKLERQKLVVAEEFRKAGKKTIKVSGHTFSFSEFNQIKIIVKEE